MKEGVVKKGENIKWERNKKENWRTKKLYEDKKNRVKETKKFRKWKIVWRQEEASQRSKKVKERRNKGWIKIEEHLSSAGSHNSTMNKKSTECNL